MSAAALSMSLDRSTYTGTLPEPTPYAGLPLEYASRTIAEPPVARMTSVSGCSSSALVPSSVTSVMQAKRSRGAPAPYAASATTFSASAVHLTARGCGLITMLQPALAAMIALYIAVDVGFVDGMIAPMTTIGVATSQTDPSSSFLVMPTVRMPCI